MNTPDIKYLESLIGKTAQSTVLTMIDEKGRKTLQPSQKITATRFEEWCGEIVIMATLGDEEVFEETLRNIR